MPRKREPKPRRLTVIRYQQPDGSRCTKGTPGAVKVVTQTESYYLELPPRVKGQPKERIALETTDEAVAWRRVRDILAERLQERLGILSDAERQAARPIADHVAEWLAAVGAGGASPKRVGMMRSRLTLLCELANWKRIGDIKVSSCQQALGKLRGGAVAGRGSAGRSRGASPQTSNHYLAHARQFSRWLRDDRRLSYDPLAGIQGVSVEEDIRHGRRVPGDDEVRVFFDHLDGRQIGHPPKIRYGMTGPRRALGYQVAMCAGLRAGELRRLTPASFDCPAGVLRVTARSDKAGRRREIAIPRWLADKVADWLSKGGGLWAAFPSANPGRAIKADLEAARAGWIAAAEGTERAARERSTVCVYEVASEDGPTYCDFHALRHWYITQVAATDGIAPSTLQALSRHADPTLTLGIYARAKAGQVRDAVEQLPDLSAERPNTDNPPQPPDPQ